MIEMDESENLECLTSDMTFDFIDRQYGRGVSERLLYPKPTGRPVGDQIGAIKKIQTVVGRALRRLVGVA